MATDENGCFRFEDIFEAQSMTLTCRSRGIHHCRARFHARRSRYQAGYNDSWRGVDAVEEGVTSDEGWALESAVGLSTAVGVFTVLTAFVGFQAAVEVRRAKYYRRTQYLAGISLVSVAA